MRRYLFALITAYAASMTLLAAWWAVRAWSYRRFFDSLMRGKHGHPVHFPGLSAIAGDFGIDLSPWESLALRFADMKAQALAATSLLIFAACLVIVSTAKVRPTGSSEPLEEASKAPLRWTRRGTLASLFFGASALVMTWAFIRWRVLHPHPWPTVVLLIAQVTAASVGFISGSWNLLRGHRRIAAAALAFAALVPLAIWGLIGLYAWGQWRQRLVPNSLPMNLAKMAASSLMLLEASVEYPNRLETDRLVMFYDRLGDPPRDAEAMDRHLARMEGLLGGPLRAKVYWVRGGLSCLGLGNLSIHGIALGSGRSPADWGTGGGLDRHELAHAALDQYRPHDADPPFFLHEGWAESQSGPGPDVLARRALEQRSSDASLGIRDMVSQGWYHRDDGPVYPLGGAFVEFLVRRDGVGKFLRLYNASREGRFGAAIREIYGVELAALEDEFWEDVRRQAGRQGEGPP